MKITIESTPLVLEIDDGVRARRWEGTTESGIPVVALVAAVSPQSQDEESLARFAAELEEVTVAEVEPEEDETPDFGACCVCETTEGIRNMIMLDKRAQVSGHGWGCVVCGLPSDGANAVLCDPCFDRFRQDPSVLTIACRGYPATDGRVAIAELEPFQHNEWLHREEQRLVETPCEDDDAEPPGGWKATLFSGLGDNRPIVGALRTTQRLHWTKEAARAEAAQWLAEMRLVPITTWDEVDDRWTIGRNQTHYVIVRRILLPEGPAPR